MENKIEDVHKQNPDVSGLVQLFLTQISEVDNKIPETCSLRTTTFLNAKIEEVENKILNHDACITTQEFNKKVTTENFKDRLKKNDLVSKIILIIN